jgi:hypothetical protein
MSGSPNSKTSAASSSCSRSLAQFGGSSVIDRVDQRRVVDAASTHWLCRHHRDIHISDAFARGRSLSLINLGENAT